jgi:DNA invertase Pin-like site-specific DNA recombinase
VSVDTAQKVTASHLGRNAYLYVRQSTLRQVMTNTESATRQYALRQRAVALGWAAEQIIVIDCDQGQSGSSAVDREGFQRLAAEVGMGRAGIVLGLEVSRLARNNADWHRLLELCALGATLICDEDGLYDPCDFNDRLLLGLKGTMSEAELHFIRARLRGGIISKAKRGELVVALPVGFVYDPAERVVLDPDAGVQHAIRLLFATFARTGSARAVVQTFAAEGLQFPLRVRSGPAKGELAWEPLRHWRVLRTLHNPRYAGAFFFGRHRWRPAPGGKTTNELQSRDKWIALIPDAHAGYIDWETFESNQAQLLSNAQARGVERNAGPAREGAALLQGLAICGRCGRRMTVRYHSRREAEIPDYQCMAACISAGVSPCLRVPGAGIDDSVATLVLDTLTPVALEVALSVQAEIETRADEADRLRHANVERARHHADVARRRYLSVDPDNRLVADTLEADWNDALRHLRDAQDDCDRATQAATALSDEHKAKIRALAANFPAVWRDPATPQRERKRMIRLLVEDVTIDRTHLIHLHIRFKGGQTTSITTPLPLKAWQAHQTNADTLALLDRLLDNHTDAEVADALNHAGHLSGRAQPFTSRIVLHLRRNHQLPSRHQRLRAAGKLTIAEFADALGVHPSTIKAWQRAGLVAGHKADDRNTRLFDPPVPGEPRLVKRQGSSLTRRVPTQPALGGAV